MAEEKAARLRELGLQESGRLALLLRYLGNLPFDQILQEYERLWNSRQVNLEPEGQTRPRNETDPTFSSWEEVFGNTGEIDDEVEDLAMRAIVTARQEQMPSPASSGVTFWMHRIDDMFLTLSVGEFGMVFNQSDSDERLKLGRMVVSLIARHARGVWIEPDSEQIGDIAQKLLRGEHGNEAMICEVVESYFTALASTTNQPTEHILIPEPEDEKGVARLIDSRIGESGLGQISGWPKRAEELAPILNIKVKDLNTLKELGLLDASGRQVVSGGRGGKPKPTYIRRNAIVADVMLHAIGGRELEQLSQDELAKLVRLKVAVTKELRYF